MALLDFLKKKKQTEKAKKPVKKQEKALAEGKPAQPDKSATRYPRGTPTGKGFSYEAIKQPHISEKASYLAERDQYIFEVLPHYSKNEIKKAVEGIYGVDVLSVNTIKIPSKKRRLGRTEGFRKAYKKAIIKIKEGQKIEIL